MGGPHWTDVYGDGSRRSAFYTTKPKICFVPESDSLVREKESI